MRDLFPGFVRSFFTEEEKTDAARQNFDSFFTSPKIMPELFAIVQHFPDV